MREIERKELKGLGGWLVLFKFTFSTRLPAFCS